MDAGIGATGAVHGHGPPFDLRQRVLKLALDGAAFGLALPSDVVGAVVGEGELEGPHGWPLGAVRGSD